MQFIDLSSKIVLTALKIYKSPSGTTQDGFDVKAEADRISTLKCRIESDLSRPFTSQDAQLSALEKQCVETADEVVTLFRSTIIRNRSMGFMIATKEALRLFWRDDIEKLLGKLALFRQRPALHVLVDLQ